MCACVHACMRVCVRVSYYLEHQNSQSGYCTARVGMVRDGRGAAAADICISCYLTGVQRLAGALC